jgi:predicted heme/steroid binding protein
MHRTSSDLTEALEQATHDFDLLEKFPIVGELVK